MSVAAKSGSPSRNYITSVLLLPKDVFMIRAVVDSLVLFSVVGSVGFLHPSNEFLCVDVFICLMCEEDQA